MGQTKRKLKIKIKEHKININKPTNLLSVISSHRLNENHVLDWNNVLILDSEPSYYKRTISEMIHIKKQKSSLNKQSDIDKLPELYLPLLNIISHLQSLSYPFFVFPSSLNKFSNKYKYKKTEHRVN